jgi:hypothetical protein
MGNEAKCELRVGRNSYQGKALLETSELIFRSAEYRAKILFTDIRAIAANDGELRVETKDEAFVFDGLGSAAAEKWRDKILHPKSRIEKLGVKPGTRVAIVGGSEAAFSKELKQAKAEIVANGDAELVFLTLALEDGTAGVAKAAKKLKGAAGLWVVYPKGKKELTEVGVISAGRKAGLKDVKVVGFSPTHTALKFVIPVDKR